MEDSTNKQPEQRCAQSEKDSKVIWFHGDEMKKDKEKDG